MTEQTVLVTFAINDPDNGMDTGIARAFAFDHDLDVDGADISCKRINNHAIKIGRRKFPIISYSSWIGNWCWDGARVSVSTANDIANYLRSMKKFSPVSGVERLWDMWESEAPMDFSNSFKQD